MLSSMYHHQEMIGIETRFDHEECGDQRQRLYVKRTRAGYLYHCFNCNIHGFERADSGMTPVQTLRALEKLKEYQEVKCTKLYMPDDFTPDIPDTGKVWLYKYGITEEEIIRYKFGSYHNGSRLFLPVFDGDDLIYYQGRLLVGKGPKYLNVRAAGAKNVFFKSHQTDCSTLCITEDILSAIKVGRHVQGLALLGSYMPLSLTQIIKGYERVYLWLDPDKRKEAAKYAKQFSSLTGISVIPLFTDKDPKEHSDAEINRCMGMSE